MDTFTDRTSTEGADVKIEAKVIDTTAEVITIVESATGFRLVWQAVDTVIENLLDSGMPAIELDVERVAAYIIDLHRERLTAPGHLEGATPD